MKIHRINAIILHHFYFWYKSMPRWLDIFYWPIVTIAVWGFISNFVQSREAESAEQVAVYLLGGVILWMLFQRAQQDLAISYLQDIWSRSIVNLYVTPLTNAEFVVASMFIGILKVLITLAVMGFLAALLYAFNIFNLGFSLLPFVALLLLFAWALGLFVTGIIFRYGTDAQVLAFGISFVLQPIAAVFYPVAILPGWLQIAAQALPLTHVFEGMRAVMTTGLIPWASLGWAVVLNIVYLLLGAWYFAAMFNHTKKMGLLAKLE